MKAMILSEYGPDAKFQLTEIEAPTATAHKQIRGHFLLPPIMTKAMTESPKSDDQRRRPSPEGNGEEKSAKMLKWIPAFAGMT